MKVLELIDEEPLWVSPRTSIADVAKVMEESNCAFIPILEESRAVGVVTDRDVALALAVKGRDASHTSVKEVMSVSPHCVNSDATPEDAAHEMIAHNVRRLVVNGNDRFLGVLSVSDLAGFVSDGQIAETLRTIGTLNHPRHLRHIRNFQPPSYACNSANHICVPGEYLG